VFAKLLEIFDFFMFLLDFWWLRRMFFLLVLLLSLVASLRKL